MTKTNKHQLYIFDKEVVKCITEKYEMSYMEAFKSFLNSKTYKMLENDELKMIYFSPLAIFDMWECEKVTGTPQNSVYLRSEV